MYLDLYEEPQDHHKPSRKKIAKVIDKRNVKYKSRHKTFRADKLREIASSSALKEYVNYPTVAELVDAK